jgi:quercetin dioxygenase-like cupin family protein
MEGSSMMHIRKLSTVALVTGAILSGATAASAESTVITANGSRANTPGPAENFTGTVFVEPVYPSNDSTASTGGHVTFSPGARSAWHTHPAGQVLIITDGTGWVQEEGGAKREVKPGDVVWTPPGVKHWHGATATTGMRHIAITNIANGKGVDWMEKVSDEQYRAN